MVLLTDGELRNYCDREVIASTVVSVVPVSVGYARGWDSEIGVVADF